MTDKDIDQIEIEILDARLNALHKRSAYYDKMAKYHYDRYSEYVEDRNKTSERISAVMARLGELRGVAAQKWI